ncbi:hypothetical protein B5S28_g5071 [[Candida] boidinii]|nr:hypothetical protein B5S28_g5071 [[Candida] boidinii]
MKLSKRTIVWRYPKLIGRSYEICSPSQLNDGLLFSQYFVNDAPIYIGADDSNKYPGSQYNYYYEGKCHRDLPLLLSSNKALQDIGIQRLPIIKESWDAYSHSMVDPHFENRYAYSIFPIIFSICTAAVITCFLTFVIFTKQYLSTQRPSYLLKSSCLISSILLIGLYIYSLVNLTNQHYSGEISAEILVETLVDLVGFNIVYLLSFLLLLMTQVQITMRLFPRTKEKRVIFFLGVSLSVITQILWSISTFTPSSYDFSTDDTIAIIPAFVYLLRISLSALYSCLVCVFFVSKRQFLFKSEIYLLTITMIISVNLPIGFFIADVSNIWVNELSEVFNITCYNISNVVSWEWINRITQLEKTEQKKGVLGRPMYDEEFLLKKQMIFDFSNSNSKYKKLKKNKSNNKHKNNAYSSASSNIDINNNNNPRHTIHSINNNESDDDENDLLLGKSMSDHSRKTKIYNNSSDISSSFTNNKNNLSKKKKYIVRNSEGGAIIYSNELEKNNKSMKILNKLAKPIINYTDAIIKYGLSIPRSVSHSSNSNNNNNNDNNNNRKSVSPWGGYGFFPISQRNKINLNNSNNNILNNNNNNNRNNDQGGSGSNNHIFIYSPKEVVVDNSQWNNNNNNNETSGNNKKGNINNRLHGYNFKRNRQKIIINNNNNNNSNNNNINNNNNNNSINNKNNGVSNLHNNTINNGNICGIESTNSNNINARRDHDIQSTTTNTNTDISNSNNNNNNNNNSNSRNITMFTNKDTYSLSRTNSTIENFKMTASKVTIPKLFKKKPPIEPVIHQSSSLIPYSSFENLSNLKDSQEGNVINNKDSDDIVNLNKHISSQQHLVSETNDATQIQRTNSNVQSLNSHHHRHSSNINSNQPNTIAATAVTSVDRISSESSKADNLIQSEELGNNVTKHGKNLNSTALYHTTSIRESNEEYEDEDDDEGEEEYDEEYDESEIYIPVVDNTNNVIVLDQDFDDDEDD